MYLNKISGLKTEDLTDLTPEARNSLKHILELEEWSRLQLNKAHIDFVELPLVTHLNIDVLVAALQKALP
jgi:hypothetical protein